MSKQQRNIPRPLDEGPDKMSRELAAVLRALGLAMPRTEAEVAAVEAWLAEHPPTLPASLCDAEAAFRGGGGHVLPIRPPRHQDATEASENLARAAREGREIPAEVERRMREDRERTERERQDD